ncbi:MAG TPA: DinB family protein [Gemmatimonadales bacterium]
MGTRAETLAARIEQGAAALAAFAETLSESEWATELPRDGRTVGVLVHHVASVYPIEIELAQVLRSGQPIKGVTWSVVADMNAKHAHDHNRVSQREAVELLLRNSRTAAQAVRQFTDEELDRAAPVSLNGDAPLTTQFFIEDHALRHSFHHLARIRAALGK